MRILVTGAAGFIGSYICEALVNRGNSVLGLDSINNYYDVSIKHARLSRLNGQDGFNFIQQDIANYDEISCIFNKESFDTVIHLAAQAGVRYSIENPFAYLNSNLSGHMSMIEAIRNAPNRPYLIYASSSSVYGNSSEAPFSESARADKPVSLYAATKRADELLSESYANLYGLKQVGLRFFTVYGPWGRPDMAYWSFADRILKGQPIQIFNGGDLRRDFTWIGDIIDGMVRIVERGPRDDLPVHTIYNIGNNRPEKLMDFISTLEQALGREAIKEFVPMQPGDVYETAADITAISRDFGFSPSTPISVGLKKFADWFIDYSKVSAGA